MEPVVIRPAVDEDMTSLKAVFRRASLSNAGDRTSLLAHPEVLELAEDRVRDGHAVVALAGDQVAGFATSLDGAEAVELDGLFVDPDWMRLGIARQLLAAVVARASASGRARIEVTANDHAMAFYESTGFIRDGTVETRFDTATRMHLDVDPSDG